MSQFFYLSLAAAKKENVEKEYWIDFEMVTRDKVAEYKQRAQ